jgi:endonuclease/exonuclease/phosphatase family metal-dependent hydrolase
VRKLVELALAAAAIVGLLHQASGSASNLRAQVSDSAIANTHRLTVMSYNIKGLPWPVASGRPEALARIAARLAASRITASQPHIVMFQEAFSDAAKAIGAEAGYRYVVSGPSRSEVASAALTPSEQAFESRASWLKGERAGKWEDSGLLILSDYPILSVKRMAFPSSACAGYDCLANKGAVLAWVKVPGTAEPIAVVNTHLNSRGASGVANSRSDAAYARQVQALRSFIRNNIPISATAIVGGDLNIGHVPERIAAAFAGAGLLQGAHDAVRSALISDLIKPGRERADATALVARNKDWAFFRAGGPGGIALQSVSIPFGLERDGSMLSDHIGYEADFMLS